MLFGMVSGVGRGMGVLDGVVVGEGKGAVFGVNLGQQRALPKLLWEELLHMYSSASCRSSNCQTLLMNLVFFQPEILLSMV